MRLSVADVLARLRAEGLATVAADAPARAALSEGTHDDMPWYMRVAVGLGAWVATGFLFGFLFTIAQLEGDVARLGVGVVLVGGATWVRRTRESEFVRQAAVATSLAGQGLMLAGVHELFDSTRGTAVVAALVSITLIWVMPDRVHRYLSAVAFAVSAYIAVIDAKTPHGFEVMTLGLVVLGGAVWQVRVADRSEQLAEMLEPAGYGLVLVLFGALLLANTAYFGHVSMDVGGEVVLTAATTIGITLALVALVWRIVDGHGGSLGSGKAFAAVMGVIALGAGALSTPGIVAGAAVLTLAFDRRDKVLLGMGALFLLVFGSVYYYSLHITLLEKSGVLAGSGALLLAIRHRLVKP